MTRPGSDFCDHCGLPLGAWPHEGEGEGQRHNFCCYGCFIGWQAAHGGGDDAVAAGFLIRLGLGAFLAMNIMLFSLLLYSGALDGIDVGLRSNFHILLWVLATPVLIVLGGPFFREAMADAKRGCLAPSLLIALGTGAAYAYSAVATLQGSERVYFDTIAMVLVLFTLGRYLEASGRARAARSLRPMMEAEGQLARCRVAGADVMRPLSEVIRGTVVSIGPGELVPVDGVVAEGVSQMEEVLLTGEPRPVSKTPGAPVLAGSMNGDGALLIKATTDGLASRWIRICRDVRAALSRPSQAQRMAERAAQFFVPLVILIAAGTVWINWQLGAADTALLSGLAVLVVACPCALGLAAPLATSLAVANLASKGILVRSGAALETLAGVQAVAFDKTGTLTDGHITCRDVKAAHAILETVLSRAAGVASHSRHPLSRAICEEAVQRGVPEVQVSQVQVFPGEGVQGIVNEQTVLVGSRRWLEAEGLRVSQELAEAYKIAAEEGHLLTCVGWGGSVFGLFSFDDKVHRDAKALIQALERDGFASLVLTGDGKQQAGRLSDRVGVKRWYAELLPNDKQALLNHLEQEIGPLAMVGDGVNDAPAMTAAAVGIAVGDGTELARETAEIVLPPDGIILLSELLRTARITRRTIASNLTWAFGYNGVAVALAAAGFLQPIIAAALMAGSSVFVVMNTVARLGIKQTEDAPAAHRIGPEPCCE